MHHFSFWTSISSPTGGNSSFLSHFNANFVQKWQKCQIGVIYENLDYMLQLTSLVKCYSAQESP